MWSKCGNRRQTSGALVKRLLGTFFLSYGALASAGPTAPPVGASDPDREAASPTDYRLITLAQPGARMPMLPGVTSLGGGQELLFSLPADYGFDLLSHASLDDAIGPLDRLRATYRYTWLACERRSNP